LSYDSQQSKQQQQLKGRDINFSLMVLFIITQVQAKVISSSNLSRSALFLSVAVVALWLHLRQLAWGNFSD